MGVSYKTLIDVNMTMIEEKCSLELATFIQEKIRATMGGITTNYGESLIYKMLPYNVDFVKETIQGVLPNTVCFNNLDDAIAKIKDIDVQKPKEYRFDFIYRVKTGQTRISDLILTIMNVLRNMDYTKFKLADNMHIDDMLEDCISGYTQSDYECDTTFVGCDYCVDIVREFAEVNKKLYDEVDDNQKERIREVLRANMYNGTESRDIDNKISNPKFIVKAIDATNFLKKRDTQSFIDMMQSIITNMSKDTVSMLSLEYVIDEMFGVGRTSIDKGLLKMVDIMFKSLYISENVEVIGTHERDYAVICNGTITGLRTKEDNLKECFPIIENPNCELFIYRINYV